MRTFGYWGFVWCIIFLVLGFNSSVIGDDVHLFVLVGVIENFECLSSRLNRVNDNLYFYFDEISKLQSVVDNRHQRNEY